MTLFAVFGQPIAHSLSPLIHAAFARQLALAPHCYERIEAGPGRFAAALAEFRARGGAGANVTVPLKGCAVEHCESLTARARRPGSVNTLIRTATGWQGDSTDGVGLIRDLARHAAPLAGAATLLLGAGGAAAAVGVALMEAGVAELRIANRSPARAEALAGQLGARARAVPWSEALTGFRPDLLIHATALGHAATETVDWPPSTGLSDTFCYDLSYGAAARLFIDWATSRGAVTVLDGLGMLVEQAAESFAIWHGQRPEVASVLEELRRGVP